MLKLLESFENEKIMCTGESAVGTAVSLQQQRYCMCMVFDGWTISVN